MNFRQKNSKEWFSPKKKRDEKLFFSTSDWNSNWKILKIRLKFASFFFLPQNHNVWNGRNFSGSQKKTLTGNWRKKKKKPPPKIWLIFSVFSFTWKNEKDKNLMLEKKIFFSQQQNISLSQEEICFRSCQAFWVVTLTCWIVPNSDFVFVWTHTKIFPEWGFQKSSAYIKRPQPL